MFFLHGPTCHACATTGNRGRRLDKLASSDGWRSALTAGGRRLSTRLAGCLVVVVLLLASVTTASAGDDGGSPGSFLRFGGSARSLALGNAVTGVADDVAMAYWNPAGLAQLRTHELVATGVQLFEETRYAFASVGMPTDSYGTFSFGGTFVNSGGFERASLFEDLDEEFSESDGAFTVGYARGSNRLAVGVALKSITQNIGGASGSGFGADVGLYYRPAREASFGLAVQNVLAPELTLEQESERLARTMRAGAGLRFMNNRLLLLTDVVKTEYQDLSIHGGFEVWPSSGMGLRSGYDAATEQLAFGAGVRWLNWQFDYAYLGHELGGTNILSATLRFGIPYGIQMRQDRQLFSPSGADRQVEFEIQTAVSSAIESWEMVISDADGRALKRQRGNGPPPAAVTWDGADDNGRLVGDGTYQVQVVILDDLGERWQYGTSVEVMGFRDRTRKPITIEISGESPSPNGGGD